MAGYRKKITELAGKLLISNISSKIIKKQAIQWVNLT
jgi:hypothetical protein